MKPFTLKFLYYTSGITGFLIGYNMSYPRHFSIHDGDPILPFIVGVGFSLASLAILENIVEI